MFVLFAGGQQCRSHGGCGLGGVRLPPAAQRSAQQEGRLLHRYEIVLVFHFERPEVCGKMKVLIAHQHMTIMRMKTTAAALSVVCHAAQEVVLFM